MKGELFMSSNVQNQFEARLKTLKIPLYDTIYYLYANLFQNIAKKRCLNIRRYSF